MPEETKPQTLREYLRDRINYYESGEAPTPFEMYDVDCDKIVAEELKKVLTFVNNGPDNSRDNR